MIAAVMIWPHDAKRSPGLDPRRPAAAPRHGGQRPAGRIGRASAPVSRPTRAAQPTVSRPC